MDPCVTYIAELGAALRARVQLETGCRNAWRTAVDAGMLQLLHTDYGEVLVLTARGRALAPNAPYIASPGSAALRAFQVEAVEHASKIGVEDLEAVNKKAGGLKRGNEFTSQVLHFRGEYQGGSVIVYALLSPTYRSIKAKYFDHRLECVLTESRMMLLLPELSPQLSQRLHMLAVQEKKEGYSRITPLVGIVPYPGAPTRPS